MSSSWQGGTHMTPTPDTCVVTVALLPPLSPASSRGHRAYLSSAPHYDFPRYRQLVHEITLAFSGISREVLLIAGRLRDQLARPDLAQHLARLQEREQEKLQLTAQLQLARQQAQDQPEVDAHQQEVRELKHK
ncbi:hypothetical protein llap_22730 [Limosa lapponica baueri]|uniref:Uncharacterized protein n=1 Tax=Limosa lapponica baueri TaxID=1758121 RepID=A0A2I0SZI9_LIMLA|nr:hypothetical protein llap_22730 [Limosa lapponica baueri]